MSLTLTEASLAPLNARFDGSAPEEILRFVWATFGHRAAILSSMQRAGALLCHMADHAGLELEVVFVDTGVLHQQTLWTRDELSRTHPNLRVVTLSPAATFEAQTRDLGLLYLSKEGQERCCELRKSEPLLGAKGRWDALVGALRRGEGGGRSAVKPFSLDVSMGALRVHPFAAMSDAELDAAIAARPSVVVNPLHLMGFPTIGCFPCTTPVRPDEAQRAGRWRHLAGVEYCGINPTDRGTSAQSIELPEAYAALLSP